MNPGHITQIALYHNLLAALYPQHRVMACLLYTTSGQMLEVPDPLIKASLDQLAQRYG